MKKRYSFIALLLALMFQNCQKSNNTIPPPREAPPANDSVNSDVYVAGYVYENDYIAAYWKNGKITKLGTGQATGIVVNGNDTYVVGYSNISKDRTVAAYWKNGVRTLLANSAKSSRASGVAINGNDVYISGNIYLSPSVTIAAYWKNGTLYKLGNVTTQKSSTAHTVTVQNNDVYIPGGVTGKDGIINATYWKNGVPVTLNTGKNQYFSNLFALTVNGNDVYTVGQIYGLLRPGLIEYNSTYWKNGIPQSFTDATATSIATAILVKSDDVYVIGEKQTIGQYKITGGYWKNGTFIALNTGADGSEVHAATMQESDIYIGGSLMKTVKENGQDILINYPGYWKNGKFVQLSTGYGDVNSIAVIKK